jgi:hypothetical protein
LWSIPPRPLVRPKRRCTALQTLAVARARAALCASINTVSDARSDAPGRFTSPDAMADPRPLLTLDDALARLLAGALAHPIRDTEALSTFDALGRVLAEAVVSALDVPPADNTSMDGYAMHAADVPAAGTVLPVVQRIPAGVVGQPLARGTVARIFTGAQVPAGATAVVMQEQCEALPGEGLGAVRINTVPADGQWVRRQGEDVRHGATVLQPGDRLTPQALGLAASVGAARLVVRRRPASAAHPASPAHRRWKTPPRAGAAAPPAVPRPPMPPGPVPAA